jgi:nicotinate-nucleotide adenylyltransferase
MSQTKTDRPRRVAFFGGSFDPPHKGHLAVARAALQALRLDRILFAPVGTQPLKPGGAAVSFADRLAMTQLAIADEPGFELSLADAPRSTTDAPNYTFDTLAALRATLAAGDELYCLMGADSFLHLRQWHRAAELPFLAPLIVASRPGQPLADFTAALAPELKLKTNSFGAQNPAALLCYTLTNSAGENAPFYLLPDLDILISATEIRARLHENAYAGESRLPSRVVQYIVSHRLYQ